MAFFDQDDELNQRDPHDMQLLVNVISAVGADNVAKRSFLSAHLAPAMSQPSVLLSLWTSELPPPTDEVSFDESDDSEDDIDQWDLQYTLPVTPQQARALAFGLLRLADGLSIEVARGFYGIDRPIHEFEVYFSDPKL